MAQDTAVSERPKETTTEHTREPTSDVAAKFLLRGKTWRYLRYLHFRESLAKVANQIETVCICGAGHGLAEIMIAEEFPHLQITLTDIHNVEGGYPNYHRAMDLAWRRGIRNVEFGIWNVLQPTKRGFDMIASTEMLEHIEDAETAAANMVHSCKRFLYCLVPFADKAANADAELRQGVWDRHEHFVVGYEAERLTELFPNPVHIHGTYWRDAGVPWRARMEKMSGDEIEAQADALKKEAKTDLIPRTPKKFGECQGIKILSDIRKHKRALAQTS
ncbi:MAG: class I SAM-dependent methyltransferase [Pseudomonadota bacterium]